LKALAPTPARTPTTSPLRLSCPAAASILQVGVGQTMLQVLRNAGVMVASPAKAAPAARAKWVCSVARPITATRCCCPKRRPAQVMVCVSRAQGASLGARPVSTAPHERSSARGRARSGPGLHAHGAHLRGTMHGCAWWPPLTPRIAARRPLPATLAARPTAPRRCAPTRRCSGCTWPRPTQCTPSTSELAASPWQACAGGKAHGPEPGRLRPHDGGLRPQAPSWWWATATASMRPCGKRAS
jgi:hypothetical protein